MAEYDNTLSVQENLARAIFALAAALEKHGQVVPGQESGIKESGVTIKHEARTILPRETIPGEAIRVGDRIFHPGSRFNESFTVTKITFCPYVGGEILGRDDTDGHTVSWGLNRKTTVERRIS